MIIHNESGLPTVDYRQAKPLQGNLKDLSKDNHDKLLKVLNKRGFTTPLFVWRSPKKLSPSDAEQIEADTLYLMDGHQRSRVMQANDLNDNGSYEVPYVLIPAKSLKDAKEQLLEITSQYGHMTVEGLDEFAFDLELADLDINFDAIDLDKFMDSQVDEDEADDEAPEVDEVNPPVSVLGEVYQLGAHRLMCGDSTSLEAVEQLMDGAKADMVFTDPPYGMKKENEGVLNDNLNFDDLLSFNRLWITLTFEYLKENGSWYCWGIDEPLMDIYSHIIKPLVKAQKATFRNLITWDKGSGQGQNAEDFRMYPIADEKCLFVMCGVQGFNTNQDNYYEAWEPIRLYLDGEKKLMGWTDKWIASQLGVDPRLHWFSKSQWDLPTKDKYLALQTLAKGEAFKRDYESVKRDYESVKRDYESVKRDYYATRSYFDNTHSNQNNVWHFDRTPNEERQDTGGHATPKPIALCSRGIKSSSRKGEIVLDLFLGSGSTLIASEVLGRTCYGMELDERYCDVIRKRYAKHIGAEDWEAATPAVEYAQA